MNFKVEPTFSNPKSLGKRDWGTEELLELSSGKWSLKKLFIKKGFKGGLQFHRKKDEGGYLVKGKLIIRYIDKSNNIKELLLRSGQSFRFPPQCIHQEEAVTDCLIIEVSTPHLNDRVRVEDQFGLEVKGGLPSTEFSDIVLM